MNLTDQQINAISHDGCAVITACPGSGKTTIVKEKIIVVVQSIRPYQGVIAISFTVKASQELKARSTANGIDCKGSYFGTIDSFCLNEIISPFIDRVWNGSISDCRIVKNIPRHKEHEFSSISKSPSIREIEETIDCFQSLYHEGYIWMSSFAGLANHILDRCPAAVRYLKSKYTHVFIDEYQDTSLSQHELFVSLVDLGLIGTAVGDTDQSIFAFRGGDSQHILELQKNTDKFFHFVVDINHRSHPSIVNYANRLLNPDINLIDVGDEKSRVMRIELPGAAKNASEHLSVQIQKWIDEDESVTLSSIAFLAKKEATLIALAEGLSVNYRIYIDTPLHNIDSAVSELVIDLLSYYFGSIKSTVEMINKCFDVHLPKYDLHARVHIKKALNMFRTANSVLEICSQIEALLDLAGYSDSFDDVVVQLRKTLEDEKYRGTFKPVTEDKLQLMTLHKSKGLEFKHVFHFDLEEWSFPYRKPGRVWGDPPDYPTLEQETNLHYVGITRAEDHCILVKSELRVNSKGELKNADPSYFFTLPQLEGLYG